MADRPHHSIGEVLSLLKDDFADVTISKIRFLESQGLIDPERTPSGYRKFYDDDIERLRWILTQQRDNFLPLKVIKRRLEDAGFELSEASTAPDGPLPEPTLFARRDDDRGEESDDPTSPAQDIPPEPVARSAADADRPPEPDEGDDGSDATTAPAPASAVPSPAAAPFAAGDPLAEPTGSVSLTAGELATAAGVELAFIGELVKLGLVAEIAGEGAAASFDGEALVVAKAAAGLAGRGLEPRHLRMFKVAAEREAGLFEQLTSPLTHKGDDGRALARTELNELARLGETIHRSVLRRALGSSLG